MRRVRGALVAEPLVITCDALGGIGAKPGDAVAAPSFVVGRFTARVALMELIALGAEPLALAVALCMEHDEEILRGVQEEAGLPLTWSSEHNVPVAQTAVGVTVIGRAEHVRLGGGRAGDAVVALGRPKAGSAVRLDDPEIADIPRLRRVLACCRSVVPVGHGGLAVRAAELAAEARLRFEPCPPVSWNLRASAGPATSLVAVTDDPDSLAAAWGVPGAWAVIGCLVA